MAWHEAPKYRDHPQVTRYLADCTEEQRAILERIRDRLKQDPHVMEFIAWGVPCYWRRGPMAYTSAAKTHITLGFFHGHAIGMGLTSTGKSPIGKHVWKLGADAPVNLEAWIGSTFDIDEMHNAEKPFLEDGQT